MRFPLNFPRSPAGAATASRVSPPKQTSFSDRLAAGRQPDAGSAAADGSETEDLTRELIKQYLQQNALMGQIMCSPGPLPDRETD